LTYWCLLDILTSYGAAYRTPPKGERASKNLGGSHEAGSCLLCGTRLRGSPLDLSAAIHPIQRSGYTLSFLWPVIRACDLGCAGSRCLPACPARPIFRSTSFAPRD
jgi:hypothetical protein